MIYPLHNQDYRFYKCRYNKGLNFRVFSTSNNNTKSARISKGFYILKVPEDRDSQNYFRVEV
ncbi:hypothetical protein CQA53_10955 [Helicobacter didelphidarum]|uniref:Uncharacterized protein n=1 Tax=Helicobacter didelphidarum TaxID=2040648 RepID=A0A3D8I5F8_9HELI|nr:hypothetical protein [Helicobacter didelphidarum]RDU60368.1 hypothetical protein CQA53_10955 [Helicobacter didelphidarum]